MKLPIQNKKGENGIFFPRVFMLALFIGLLFYQSAFSQNSSGAFGEMFAGHPDEIPKVAAFITENGEKFTLDRQNETLVFLKFNDSDEVWALTSSWGPRGDEFLRNDLGKAMVRITSLGGVTLYKPKDIVGYAARYLGQSPPIPNIKPVYGKSLQEIAEGEVALFNSKYFPNLTVEIGNNVPKTLARDALIRTRFAFAKSKEISAVASNIKIIRITRASSAFAIKYGNTLEIGVAEGISWAGLPSSEAINAALTHR